MVTQVAPSPIQVALPSYEIGGELGRGAMGVVLAARHRQLERDVAIKQLPPAFAADEDVRRRFGQEARTLAALAHPHIVPVYDYVEREGLCLLVMEALPGGTLWDRFTGEGVTMSTACTAMLAICAGLHSAHAKGVLHRDVKPENLMFAQDKTLKVTDFGIAQMFGGDETVTTIGGAVIGTPAYMAPEQAEGRPCGPPADVYATATVLYELLSGTLPFSIEGDSFEILERRVHEDPTPLSDVASNVPEPLVVCIMRALERDPGARYSNAEDFGVAIAEAATESFGPGWVGRADLTLLATGPIAAAAGPTTLVPGVAGDLTFSDHGAQTGRETMVAGKGAPIPRDAPLRMRATAIRHPAGVRIDELRPEDLVRVDDLIAPPKAPRGALALSAVALIALLLVGALGIGTPHASTSLPRGRVAVAGTDIGSGKTVSVNFVDDVLVRVRQLPANATRARYVRLGFSVLGIQLPASRSAELRQTSGGDLEARVDAQRLRFLVSGDIKGQLRFLDASKRELRADEFNVDSDRPFAVTANGVLALLLVAFVLSYGWSISHPLRRGRRSRAAFVAMAVLGGVLGGAVASFGWAAFGPEPTAATVASVVILGAIGSTSLAQATLVSGRRRRLALARARHDAGPTDED